MSVFLRRYIVILRNHLVLQLLIYHDERIFEISLDILVMFRGRALNSRWGIDHSVRILYCLTCLTVEKLKFQPKRCNTLLNRNFEMHVEAWNQLYILILDIFWGDRFGVECSDLLISIQAVAELVHECLTFSLASVDRCLWVVCKVAHLWILDQV